MSIRNAARQIVTPNLSKNSFDLSNYWMGTGRIGAVIPVRWDDVTPNSNWRYKLNFRIKMAPIIYPFSHRVDACYYTAFMPYRLMMAASGSTYSGWKDFIMGDPQSRFTNDVIPQWTLNDANKGFTYRGTLGNHLGLPALDGQTVNAAANLELSEFPFIAYHMLYDEFLRNPWTQERSVGEGSSYIIDLETRDHAAVGAMFSHRYANYDADYLMGATPEAYSGSSSDVELDLDIVSPDGYLDFMVRTTGAAPAAGGLSVTAGGRLQDTTPNNLSLAGAYSAGAITTELTSTLEIMELRRAQALTRFLEAENRSGEEYYDTWLKVMFGHNVDMKFAKPVYLGGGRQAINVNEVLSTAETYDYTGNDLTTQQTLNPQGTQVGHAMVSTGGETINFYASEPGILMTVLVIKPIPAYSGFIEKYWLKDDRTEFYNYHFQGIGDQAILNHEVGYDVSAGNDNLGTWAYSTRWEEYKQKQNIFCGDYVTSGLDAWHMGKLHDVSGAPSAFAASFTAITPGNDENLRIFADQSETYDELWIQVYNDMQVQLPMHKVDIPQ